MRGQWKANRVFMGSDDICHGSLVGEDRAHYIISFGEDENGIRTSVRWVVITSIT